MRLFIAIAGLGEQARTAARTSITAYYPRPRPERLGRYQPTNCHRTAASSTQPSCPARPLAVALALLVRAASGAPAPTLSVRALGPAAPPAKPIADGHFQMMPAGCSGAACTGFKIGNPADLKSRTNSAAFKVGASKVALDASKARTLVEVGTVELTNGGFMQPTGERARVVCVRCAYLGVVVGAP